MLMSHNSFDLFTTNWPSVAQLLLIERIPGAFNQHLLQNVDSVLLPDYF